MIIYAHRGASGYKVENTFSAFDLAIEQGANGIESDIFITKDGVLFMFHDNRCKLKNGDENALIETKTSSLYSKDLKNIILPDNESVPLFEDFLKKYAGKRAKTDELLKISLDIHYKTEQAVAKMIVKYGCEDQFYICSPVGYQHRHVRKISEKIHLVASNSVRKFTLRTFKKKWSKYQRNKVEIFNIKAADVKEEWLEVFKKTNTPYYIWDLHDEERLRKYLPYEPHGIYSNYPDLAIKIKEEISSNKI